MKWKRRGISVWWIEGKKKHSVWWIWREKKTTGPLHFSNLNGDDFSVNFIEFQLEGFEIIHHEFPRRGFFEVLSSLLGVSPCLFPLEVCCFFFCLQITDLEQDNGNGNSTSFSFLSMSSLNFRSKMCVFSVVITDRELIYFLNGVEANLGRPVATCRMLRRRY